MVTNNSCSENSVSSETGLDWAAKEVEIAIQTEMSSGDPSEWNYGAKCYKSALRAYRTLELDEHSGYSIQVTKEILNRLIDHKCLTPVEDTPDVWYDISDWYQDGSKHYQCKRLTSLFKTVYPDGTVTFHDTDRAYGVSENSPDITFTSGAISNLIDELFPISLPYYPFSHKFKVVTDEFLVDAKNGDYDTIGYLSCTTPTGDRIEINRYFKEENGELIPIEKDEFYERKKRRIDKGETEDEK